ncbi:MULTISPECIES: sugar phosphate isomerase/epimerase family protein [Bifidobacterium]|jgi:sugar phosphate isomerase/epimerase|uniref:Sugar phosphate isomerase/epimerase n=1 Tax=Bifidobacterium tibiigranuli TaxID=2172043 RepID=A0A5N6S143_9BIFI|nr:sugar phosphate isomerase/epimerase [Bifidobacterium tibiigranuli]KAE8127381.1 sugar phosphate isomerase/epimerase [Bifidobacterium tibiigranuli]KAE8129772.1 sugar phosphate isomerase/epimerase [Bifidobacterium tibiigranuli]MCI1212271.1 sugar phosphate isomerase/epimerase [Bifidobacterium tibiigranuli]MCI1221516.1 sugar phosphate isomerase/epimerase [Bifidobacterium tibiigranuli]
MHILGINTLVYQSQLSQERRQSTLVNEIARLVTLVEVRREFIRDQVELKAIHDAVEQHHMQLFYSVPESIAMNGSAHPQLETFLEEASAMGAARVKFNQGDIKDCSAEVIADIDAKAAERKLALTIENDQTPENGTLDETTQALARLRDCGSRIGYTFDLGNWFWQGGDPVAAFEALSSYITDFHLKNISGPVDPETTMLEDGVIPWRQLVAKLPDSTPVLLEFPIAPEQVSGQVDIAKRGI